MLGRHRPAAAVRAERAVRGAVPRRRRSVTTAARVSLPPPAGRSSGWPGCRAPGHLAVLRRRLRAGATDAGRSGAGGAAPRRRARPSRPGSRSSPSDRKRYGLMLDQAAVAERERGTLARARPRRRDALARRDGRTRRRAWSGGCDPRRPGRPGRGAVRRQPAEGGARQVAGRRSGGVRAGRPDPRRGRRRARRDARDRAGPGGRRQGRPYRLDGPDRAVDLCDRVLVFQRGRITDEIAVRRFPSRR